jgi:polar amino acid transport system permease protein
MTTIRQRVSGTTTNNNGMEYIPLRHRGRWAAAAVVVIALAQLGTSAIRNKRFQWDVVGHYLFAKPVLTGVQHTIELTVISMVLATILGVLLASMVLSDNWLLSYFAKTYLWVIRSTPILVQLLVWYYLAAVFPVIGFGIPFGGPTFVSASANSIVTQFSAAILGLTINCSAYMAEIIRGGILGLEKGQTEAALSLGMRSSQVLRLVILPQAMRVIIPPSGNQFIDTLKTTSMVIVIGYTDLLTSVTAIYSQNYDTIPLLIVATLWYLAMTGVLTIGQTRLERHYARGV